RLRDHGHGIDDLRVARHGVKMHAGAAYQIARIREMPGRHALADEREYEKHHARTHDDEAQIGVDQKDHQYEQGAEWRIENGEQSARGNKAAELLKVTQYVVVLAVAAQ